MNKISMKNKLIAIVLSLSMLISLVPSFSLTFTAQTDGETPVCTCTPVDGVHTEDCALYDSSDDGNADPAPDNATGSDETNGNDGSDGTNETNGNDGSTGTNETNGNDGSTDTNETNGNDGSTDTDETNDNDGSTGTDDTNGNNDTTGTDETNGNDGSTATDETNGNDGSDDTDETNDNNGSTGTNETNGNDGYTGTNEPALGDASSDGAGPGAGSGDAPGAGPGEPTVIETTTPQVGAKIWIKKGSNVYKTQNFENSYTLWLDHNVEVVALIQNELGITIGYEFKYLSWDLTQIGIHDYKYVKVENTTTEEPETDESVDENACNCGENAPANLADHDNTCPRKQYVNSLYNDKTADQIYAEWQNYDEALRTDLLDMLKIYDSTKYKTLIDLIYIQDDTPNIEELDDGIIVSVDGIPSDAYLSVSIVDSEKSNIIDSVADGLFAIDTSVAYGGVFSLNCDIKIMQAGKEWQPANGESVLVTIEVSNFHIDYRTYLQGVHILDTVEAIAAAVSAGEAISMTEVGLSDLFPTETSVAVSAGFPEDTIVYTIMLPELGDMYAQNGNIVIDATSFSSINITAFNVDNSEYLSEVEEAGLKLDKTADVHFETGEGYVELSSYVKGEVSNTPTDVVLVIDHSGSMWTAVDPENGQLNYGDLDQEKGAREGYYVGFLRNVESGKQASTACLLRYSGGKWQRSKYVTSTVYDSSPSNFVGFIETTYGSERGWTDLENPDNHIFAVSISGALYDALNIFMEEMENAKDCRVAICTFSGNAMDNKEETGDELVSTKDFQGSGIFVNGTITWDGTVNGKSQSTYIDAFEDPSTQDGQAMLNKTIANINTDFGSTPTALGLLYARRLFFQAGRDGAQKIAIVFTDGIPSPSYLRTRYPENCQHDARSFYVSNYESAAKAKSAAVEFAGDCEYCEPIEYQSDENGPYYKCTSTYVDQAKRLKEQQGATVYSIGPKAGKAGVDVLEKIASSSNHYFNASGTDMAEVFRQIAGFIVSSSQDVDSDTKSVDVVSGSFMLPTGITKEDIEVYTADYTGVDSNGVDTFSSNLVPLNGAEINVDESGKKVEVWGFDYEGNAVGMEGTVSTGKKLVIRIPIVQEPDFLGGNNVKTNDSASGIFNDTNLVLPFPEPVVNVKVKQIDPDITDSNIYLSQAVGIPQVVNIGEFHVDETEYTVDGENNKYVDITYTVKDEDGNTLFTYTIPAGKTYKEVCDDLEKQDIISQVLTKDTHYYVTYRMESVSDYTNYSSNKDAPVNATVNVYMPHITFQDSVMNLGQTANYDGSDANNTVTMNYVNNVVWKHGDTVANNMGSAPTLQFTYDPAEDKFTQDQSVKVTSVISLKGNNVPENMDILKYVTFYRDGCNFRLCDHKQSSKVEDEACNFIVHLNTFDLIIRKTGSQAIDENQTFIFRIIGPDSFNMDVTINGNGEVRVVSLPVGNTNYTVTELTNWSWRYLPKDGASKTVSLANSNDGTVTVSFENERKKIYWLSGDSWCDNLFSRTSGSSD